MKQTALNDQNTEIQTPNLNTLLPLMFCHSSEVLPESCNFLKYKNPFKRKFSLSLLGWTKNSHECNYYPLTSSFSSTAYAILRNISRGNQHSYLCYSSISKPLPRVSPSEFFLYTSLMQQIVPTSKILNGNQVVLNV